MQNVSIYVQQKKRVEKIFKNLFFTWYQNLHRHSLHRLWINKFKSIIVIYSSFHFFFVLLYTTQLFFTEWKRVQVSYSQYLCNTSSKEDVQFSLSTAMFAVRISAFFRWQANWNQLFRSFSKAADCEAKRLKTNENYLKKLTNVPHWQAMCTFLCRCACVNRLKREWEFQLLIVCLSRQSGARLGARNVLLVPLLLMPLSLSLFVSRSQVSSSFTSKVLPLNSGFFFVVLSS